MRHMPRIDAPPAQESTIPQTIDGKPGPVPSRTEEARARLLAAAERLICARGVSGTGIEAILAEADVAKATLYRLFGSKEALVEAVLDRHSRRWSAWFAARLAETPGRAEERLLAGFDILGEWFRSPGFRGCPILNAIGEGPAAGEAPRRVAAAHKARLSPVLLSLAREAGVPDPAALVETFILLMDGAIVVALASGSPAPATTARAAFAAVLRAARDQFPVA